MGNLFNGFDEAKIDEATTEPQVVQIGGDLGRPAIDVVYDALIEKMDYYNSLIRDAELELKHWKEMKAELKTLIEMINKRK